MKSSLEIESCIPSVDQEINKFRASCDRHRICYTIAGSGVDGNAKLVSSANLYPDGTLFFTTEPPEAIDNVNLLPSITIREFLSYHKIRKI